MARTNIPLSALLVDSGITAPAGTTIDQPNGMNIQFPSAAIPAAPGMDEVILVVANTAGSPKVVTIDAGVGGGATPGPAFRSGVGNATFSVTNGTTAYLGPFRSGRFSQLDGSLNVDFASGFTGTITALTFPIR